MQIIIIDTYYRQFLQSFYRKHPHFIHHFYVEQYRALMDQCFGTADFYSSSLNQLGHQADDIVGNCEQLQRSWAKEHGMRWGSAFSAEQKNMRLLRVLKAQILHFKPDVLYLQSLSWPGPEFLREVLAEIKPLIVGQIASSLSPHIDLTLYDLILTSFPHFIETFKQMGVKSEYFRIGFGAGVLSRLHDNVKSNPAVFVGSFNGKNGPHDVGTRLLEYLATRVPVKYWGQGINALADDSSIRRFYYGEAWGIDSYRILAKARIALNRHAGWSANYANNMRMYEATGVGAMLLTDFKENLGDIFEIGKEVVAYRSKYECAELAKYYLEHESDREAIAAAGQQRTLNEHTYYHRMQELVDIIKRHMRDNQQSTSNRFIVPQTQTKKDNPDLKKRAVALAKSIVRSTALAKPARHFYRHIYRHIKWRGSDSYKSISRSAVTQDLVNGWQNPNIPECQRERVDKELGQMYRGKAPAVFQVAAQALTATGMEHGKVLEIGCASGYYYEVLEHLLGHKVNYTGIDYSAALVALAQQEYPDVDFLQGDTTNLLLPDGSYDVVISGCVILHVPDYQKAIAETARVARKWSIFHRTPVLLNGKTQTMTKMAYGVQVVEFVFEEKELLTLFCKNGLKISKELFIDKYHLSTSREQVIMKTYVCRKGVCIDPL